MKRAKIHIEKDFELAKTDDRLFSSFLEHLGRAVYTGIFEPGHPLADKNGFRTDVLQLIHELNISHVRYPGGNFLSGYDWKDGIGPKENRPRRLDLAWRSIESNQFGINEFYDWSKKAGTQIMGAVNMGTGTPKDAGELLEYCNFPGGTYWSDLRKKHGHPDPMNIKLWCIGNEMDGEWQICHLDADDYGKKAVETAKIMRWIDRDIELVACGSSTTLQKSYPEWDRKVMENTYDFVDYISLHRYYENEGNDFDFLASFVDMDQFIHTLTGTADYVRALKRGKKDLCFSFDEWNVWYQHNQTCRDWMEAPDLLEDQYTLLDALVFSSMGMTLINHADRVKIACLAQLVNVIAPIVTERGGRVLRQSIFYPFLFLSQYGRGTVLKPVVKTPVAESRYGKTPLIYPCVVYRPEEGVVTMFCLNISEEEMELGLELRSFGSVSMEKHLCLSGNLKARNTFEAPNTVVPKTIEPVPGVFSSCTLVLPKQSFHVIRFRSVRGSAIQ
ncbi:MAG TPA: alpha-N-arabinofuranosidase [Clostridiales bacterium]|nr:alpha-N-arabinofuranosidase [Clostridiales bacterium]